MAIATERLLALPRSDKRRSPSSHQLRAISAGTERHEPDRAGARSATTWVANAGFAGGFQYWWAVRHPGPVLTFAMVRHPCRANTRITLLLQRLACWTCAWRAIAYRIAKLWRAGRHRGHDRCGRAMPRQAALARASADCGRAGPRSCAVRRSGAEAAARRRSSRRSRKHRSRRRSIATAC